MMHFPFYFSGHKGIKKIMLILQGEGGGIPAKFPEINE
jgi:hypothetical protein